MRGYSVAVTFCDGSHVRMNRTQLNTALDLYVKFVQEGVEMKDVRGGNYGDLTYRSAIHVAMVSVSTYEDKILIRHMDSGVIDCEHEKVS